MKEQPALAFYSAVSMAFGGLALVALVLAAALAAGLSLPRGRTFLRSWVGGALRHPIGWAWFVALLATSGSLYFSEVAHLVPCQLCWYQRVTMYPLVLVLGVGLLRGDGAAWRYGLPLSLVGILVSAYHVWIQFQPSLAPETCGAGAPCSIRYLAVFGVVSIPMMAGAAFLLIIALLLLVRHVDPEPLAAARVELQ